jgi:hypothetical protein
MSSKIVTSAILAAALVSISAGTARAQVSPSDAAIANTLFEDGRKLMHEKNFAEACPRLERSYKLDPAAGTLLNMAVCHEAIGRTASAWNEFKDSLALARRENRPERVKFAQSHLDGLKDRVCSLTVRQVGQDPGLEWKIDGVKMGTESLGLALPIDPGVHTIDAIAPGKKAWKTTVEIRRDGETKSLEIPTLAAMPVEAPPPPLPPPRPIEKSRGVSPWAFVAGGFAVAGFGAMALGGIESLSNWNTRTADCGIGGDPNACSQPGIDADKAARTWAIVADIGLGVGAAGTIATIVILAVGRGKSTESPPRVSFAPTFTQTSAGFALRGVF